MQTIPVNLINLIHNFISNNEHTIDNIKLVPDSEEGLTLDSIHYTHKDFSPHLLLLLSKLAMESAYGDLSFRGTFTNKWNQVLQILEPLYNSLDKLITLLDECYANSNLPLNEINHDKLIVHSLVGIVINIDNKAIANQVLELGKIATSLLHNKVKELKC